MAPLRKSSFVIAIAAVMLLSGCTGLLGQSGPSVSDTQTDVVDNQPVLYFNYSVDDYSDVLLVNPNGDVVNRGTLEPEQSSGALVMPSPRGGTYKLVLQQGGDTVAEQEVSYEGPDPSIQSIETTWSGNTLEEVTFTVENRGDLPVQVAHPSVSVYDSNINGTSYKWIGPNKAESVSISSAFGGVSVDRPGDVPGTVEIETQNRVISGTFQEPLEPVTLTLQSLEPQWENGRLKSVDFTVQNSGDFHGRFSSSIAVRGSNVAEQTFSIAHDSTETYRIEATGFGEPAIHTVSSGGEVPLTVSIASDTGTDSQTQTTSFEGVDMDLASVDPTFFRPYGSDNEELSSIGFSVRNQGDIPLVYDAVRISIDGVSRTVSPYSTSEIDVGSSTTENLYLNDGISVSPGSHELTIELRHNGDTVATESATVSTS